MGLFTVIKDVLNPAHPAYKATKEALDRENARLSAVITSTTGGLPPAVREDPLLASVHLAASSFTE